MYLSQKTIQNLNAKLEELNALRPISPTAMAKIKEQFEIEMTYNSNAIEGNSLTLKETFWVVTQGLTIKEKSLKDHLEAKNHKEALGFLYELIEHDRKNTFSEHLIKQLHQLVVMDSQKDIAGKYRDGDVYISGADHRPPSHLEIPSAMHELVLSLQKKDLKQHPVEKAALAHHRFVHIHPFWDGNGRVGRLLMNIFILRAGYPLGIILMHDRKRYYRVLSLADDGKYAPLCEFVAQAVLRSLTIYLKLLKPSIEKDKQYISLQELSKGSPYSATYLRKLATQGKLEAFKQRRNWLSSKKALQDYCDSL